jgi:GSH-dependent disulfide-bond oxidoreductase
MIELYTAPTPNGHKVQIMLEEVGLAYEVRPVNILAGDQFAPEFLRISPDNRIPAIVDRQGPDGAPLSMFESGAILIYLAEKTGKLMPTEARARYDTLAWLMFQMGNVGPLLGQAHHFRSYAPEPIPYAIERYTNEAGRMYRVLDRHLGEHPYLAGDDYTIADVATYPWIRPYKRQGQNLADYPNLERWFATIRQRPAVQRGMAILKDFYPKDPSQLMDERAEGPRHPRTALRTGHRPAEHDDHADVPHVRGPGRVARHPSRHQARGPARRLARPTAGRADGGCRGIEMTSWVCGHTVRPPQ